MEIIALNEVKKKPRQKNITCSISYLGANFECIYLEWSTHRGPKTSEEP